MRRALVAFSALILVGAALTGCGRSVFEQREPWRAQAEEACLAQKLVRPSDTVIPIKEIDGPGVCGMTRPFRVTAFERADVGLKSRVTLACPAIAAFEAYLVQVVQPAAELYLGTRVAEINAGSYSCRGRNNQPGAKLSEHSFGNAVDIMGFTFADGRKMSVQHGWKGEQGEQDFLREIFLGACQRFTTVLAPGSNVFHYDHIHVDLARHDPRGLRHYCKPVLKFVPRLGPDGVVSLPQSPVRARPAPRFDGPPQAPIDIEEDDPYGASPMSARETASKVARAPAPAARPAGLAAAPVPPLAPRPPAARVAAAPLPLTAGPAPLSLAAPVWSAQPIY